jgi:glucose/arabinose dehydrogenase
VLAWVVVSRPSRIPRIAAISALGAAFGACGGDSSTTPTNPTTPGGSCGAGTVVAGTPALAATRVATGFASPLDVQTPSDERSRFFVVEQGGRVRVVRNGAIAATFLDISSRISSGGERGLLGLAFHPQFASNGRFFVNYTDRNGHTNISEFRANPPTSDTADAASERQIMFVNQPFANHNGGGLAFGNDGFLYIGLGDGGSGGDPQANGQNLGTRLGKMLRIDVSPASGFGVPADNPFVGRSGALPEIWAYGLRNPWRFAFDRSTGDLYIGDVGQNALEEIDVGLASRRGGENYGWNTTEGSRCFSPSSNCSMAGITLPVTEYARSDGFSVTGGVVYRGCRMPGYAGTYFYADYGTGLIRSFRLENGRAVDPRDWRAALGGGSTIRNPSAFGTDADGEIYIVDYTGTVYRIGPTGS